MTAENRGRVLAFGLGAVGYPLLELLWRRRTHWSMAVAGGSCLVLLRGLQRRGRGWSPWQLAAAGAGIITGVELAVGLFCNRLMGWKVWDYSHLPLHLWGQVCLPFTLLWAALCRVLRPLLQRLARRRPSFYSRRALRRVKRAFAFA